MDEADDSVDALIRAAAAAPPIPISNRLGDRFELVRRLGEGTFGVVYEAEDRRDGKRVALKMLRDPRAEWIHRFKREFRALRDLRHRNLVALEELFCVGERWFFTMELLSGASIIDYTRGAGRGSAFDETRLRSAFRQLMDGLAAFHAGGRVHRDVKPSNVLVTRDGRVVLLDFGLATDASRDDALASAVVGTPAYMAPEQARGRAVGAAADQYAAGIMLLEMLTGHRPDRAGYGPFQTVVSTASDRTALAPTALSDPPLPGEIAIDAAAFPPGCPDDLVACCLALIQRDPAARPSAEAVAARLRLGDTPVPVQPPAPAPPAQPPLVGRDGELAMLHSALAAVEHGALTAVVVHGESGIGKTSLARRFLDPFRASDLHLVLTGRCYEKESVPFQAFDEIVDSISEYLLRQSRLEVAGLIPRHAAQLRLLFPVIGRVDGFDRLPGLRKDSADPTELRHRAFSALRDVFVGLAERRTVIVHIDDLQWADQDSVRLLSRLLAPPDPPRMLLLATSREPIDLAALGIGGAIRTLELGPLDRSDAALLTQRLLSASRPTGEPVELDRLLDEAHGHPYFLMELVRHASRTASATGGRPSLDEALWYRANREDGDAQRILKYVCVSGVPIDSEALRATAAIPVQEFGTHCAALTQELLIRTTDGMLVPYHDRVREAVIKRIAPAELAELHARLAGVFGERGDLALQVSHLEASGQHAQAAEVAVAAARKARDGLGFEQAAALYRHALQLRPADDPERGALLRELGATLVAMGKGLEASEVYAEAAEVVAPDQRIACNIDAAHQLLTSGHLQQGTARIRALFAEQSMSYPATPLYALLRIASDRIAGALRDPRKLPVQHRAATPRDRAQLALYRATVQGLVLVDPIRAAYCVGRALRLAREIGDTQEYLYFLLLEGDLRMSETSRERAHSAVVTGCDALLDAHPGELPPAIVAVHKGARTYMNMRGGDSEALESLISADDQLARTRIAPWELVGGRTFLLTLLRRLGRYAELKQRSTAYLLDARRRNDVYSQATMRGFCNLLHLVDDDPQRARDELAPTIWISLQHGFHVQHWYDLNALMELHLYTREPPDPAQLDQQLTAFRASRLARLAVFDVETEALSGRLALAFPQLPGFGRARVRAAIRRLERTSAAYPQLLAAQLRAGLACTMGAHGEAIARLRDAIRLGKSMDMKVQPAAAGHQLAALVGGSEGEVTRPRARATLESEGVRDIARFCDLIVPGFAPVTRALAAS
ncbi:MAG TPA: protein kinase [Kofleriaceae bacterium]|jgi:tetratricopeptide (TPR) repeat protein|nr:protein kinase [Kofleriaceae bacterium]